eukprot:COSAG01_NODE_69240_length_262_cov_0.496933_1_plen_62_part_01
MRYDKLLYMKRSREFNTTGSQLQFNQGSQPVTFKKRLAFGKNGRKRAYGKGTDDSATNFPYI